MYWGAGERKKSMCCNNFHIVIFSGCHLTTAVVFSPVIGVSTLNSCVVIVSILFLCQRCFLKGELVYYSQQVVSELWFGGIYS